METIMFQVQEQKFQIEKLVSKIEKLERRNHELEAMVKHLSRLKVMPTDQSKDSLCLNERVDWDEADAQKVRNVKEQSLTARDEGQAVR